MKRCLTARKVCQKALEEGGLFGIEEELEQIRAEADVYITDYRQMKEIEE